MKASIFILLFINLMSELLIFDFNKEESLNDHWYIVNDGVMGGLSQSKIYISEDSVGVFEGSISLENNGGFAMTQHNCSIKNVTSHSIIVLKIKGDGKTYQFRIKDNRNNYYSYIQNFKTSGKTETIELKLRDFEPYFRGRKLNIPNYNEDSLEQIAILIGNKKAESFRLEIDKVSIK